MGINFHALHFLRHASRHGAFGDTVTIGRQGLRAEGVKSMFGSGSRYLEDKYCEPLLQKEFGAGRIDSIDNSQYQSASIIHDMNLDLPPDLHGQYDTVIDSGCLEHIYNAPQALKNCSLLLKPGGQVIHVLPANNFCGHGFWQFSPELFFSLYSAANGYKDTEVYLADPSSRREWFRVKAPGNGARVNVHTSKALFVLVRSVVVGKSFHHEEVQESDYLTIWAEEAGRGDEERVQPTTHEGLKGVIRNSALLYAVAKPLRAAYLRGRTRLNGFNPGLIPTGITDDIGLS